jgi:hypothetical protein
MRVLPLFSAVMLFLPAFSFGQSGLPDAGLNSLVSMPLDRTADSYQIYSALLPFGETADKAWPHRLWTIRDATVTVVPPYEPCWQQPNSSPSAQTGATRNPHIAVHPPANRSQDFEEILADFDAHCHERLLLIPSAFNTAAPVRLLSPTEQDDFHASRSISSPAGREYGGSPALFGFTEVYFNRRHTLALVYATHWCGNLCGQGMWVAFGLEDGKWKDLHWRTNGWVS